jgi:hypothetical protein
MNILSLLKNWKNLNTVWNLIEPFILKLVEKNVPNWVTKLYENLAKYSQPAIDSLFKLKEKIKESPTAVDNYCFNQGVNALEAFANYLLGVVADLRK